MVSAPTPEEFAALQDALAAALRRSDEEARINEALSGNLCRCSAYPFIRQAIASVAGGQP